MANKKAVQLTIEEFQKLNETLSLKEIVLLKGYTIRQLQSFVDYNDITINKTRNEKAKDTRAVIWAGYRHSAKLRKLEFTLTQQEFYNIIVQPCTYCNRVKTKAVSWSRARKYYNEARPKEEFWYTGIDRRDNTKGYITGNSVPCCEICNRAKSNLSLKEFEQWLGVLVEFHKKG